MHYMKRSQFVSIIVITLIILIGLTAWVIFTFRQKATVTDNSNPISCYTFTRDLKIGDGGDDVSALNYFLARELSPNLESFNSSRMKNSSEFTEETRHAVIDFEWIYVYKQNDLLRKNSTSSNGKVDRDILEKLNQLFGCKKNDVSAITILSPIKNEKLQYGTKYTIKWTYPVLETAPSPFIISLVPTVSASQKVVPPIYKIAVGIKTTSYEWDVGKVLDPAIRCDVVGANIFKSCERGDTLAPTGIYVLEICKFGTNICDTAPISLLPYEVIIPVPSQTKTAPAISSIAPPCGHIGTSITINGSNLNVGGGTLSFRKEGVGGSAHSIGKSDTAEKISYVVPEWVQPDTKSCATATSTGTYKIFVKNSLGTSNTVLFSVESGTEYPTPTISSIYPSSGSIGTKVTLIGTGFSTKGNIVTIRNSSGAFATISGESGDGTLLTFEVPQQINLPYPILLGGVDVPPFNSTTTPGIYEIKVQSLPFGNCPSAAESKDSMQFTVTGF